MVETQCNYFAPLAFPQTVEAGIRVAHAGSSSVRYEIALFAEGADTAAAQGHFVHVYVDRATQRPVTLPPALQAVVDDSRAPGRRKRRPRRRCRERRQRRLLLRVMAFTSALPLASSALACFSQAFLASPFWSSHFSLATS